MWTPLYSLCADMLTTPIEPILICSVYGHIRNPRVAPPLFPSSPLHPCPLYTPPTAGSADCSCPYGNSKFGHLFPELCNFKGDFHFWSPWYQMLLLSMMSNLRLRSVEKSMLHLVVRRLEKKQLKISAQVYEILTKLLLSSQLLAHYTYRPTSM